MIPRGSFFRGTLVLLALIGVLGQFASANAAPSTPVSDNSKTITISLPGPFNGCTFLDSGANPTSNAVLDLVRPSAFLTSANGNLVGESGAMATAELTSLQPETVVYTISPNQHWSNGSVFSGRDLVAWWQRARILASVHSDGYRAIKSMKVSTDGLTVTAVFATPYADWNLLFRDIEASGVAAGCSLASLVSRPSLGPYKVTNATPTRIVLTMNTKWANDLNRFGRIVLTTSNAIPSNVTTPFANYSLVVDRAQVQALSAHPSVLSHIGTSSNIGEITYASGRPLTMSLAVREALSWSLNRQALINQLWGSVTFSPSVAASALFSQGQSAYPGNNGSGPSTQSTTTTVSSGASSASGLSDCLACAYGVLRAAGYRHTAAGWVNANGGALTLKLAVGPSNLDRATATSVVKQWSAAGISTSVMNMSSDVAAAISVASNGADAAIFTRPTLTAPSYTARSWSGPPYSDTYPSGVRSASVSSLFAQAVKSFNPVAANAIWLSLDQSIMNSYWVRPLFTAPSLVEWASTVTGVSGGLSVSGFLDQETNWSSAPIPQG